MDGVITMDDARALVGDAKLWPRVRDFLWDFAPQIHSSWLEGMQWREALDASLMSSPRVKRYILDSLGVEPCFHAFPKEDGSRILLLDGATLESVAKWLGALACAESLRRVTSGEAVRGLKSALRGIYPDVFGYTAYFGEFASRRDAEAQSLQTVVVEEGYSLLQSVVANLPSPLVARLKFKLPKGLCASASLREAKLSAVLKLFKLKFPEAYKLCC
jgi:hypothetical protein